MHAEYLPYVVIYWAINKSYILSVSTNLKVLQSMFYVSSYTVLNDMENSLIVDVLELKCNFIR